MPAALSTQTLLLYLQADDFVIVMQAIEHSERPRRSKATGTVEICP